MTIKMVWIRVLGPFAAEVDGVPVPLGGPRQRAVLALLVSARGQAVSVDRMIEDLWRGEPPAKAVTSLQAYVSNLRKLLEPKRPPRTPAQLLVSAPPGYALRLPEDAVDAWRFERLYREAGESATPQSARALLDQALELWQGPAFAEAVDESWAQAEAARLTGLRLAARELRAMVGLRAGSAAAVVPEAELLTRDQPLREEGWRLHALALWESGRQAEALATLRRARSVFADELGLDPGPALADLEQAILAQRTEVLQASVQAQPPAPPRTAPVTASPDVFVGRDAELAALTGLAGEVGAGGGRVALVTGEAGLGKSTLLARLGEQLTAGGWLVATGRCTEAEGAPPAWPWVEALTEVARLVPAPAESAAVLAPLMSDGAAGPEADTAAGRFRLHRAVWSWLSAAARDRPTAIVLDDLHWADTETLALLAGAGTELASAPVLLIAAFRPDEAEGRLTETLATLARRSPLRLPLPGLPGSAVRRLVDALCEVPVDEQTAAALAERTGGNPFYVRESARLLDSEGALVAVSEVPEGVRDVLRRRLARLPDAAVSVLRLAAVAGRATDVEVLVDAADTDEAGVLDALEAGLISGLLTEPAPGRVRFEHALVRDTMIADLSKLRLVRMHARIAAALERADPGDVSALAHHFSAAASAATAAKAVHYCVRAAELAQRRYAHDAAVSLLVDALASFERIPGDDAEHVALLGKLLRAQVRAGAVSAARATRQRAVDLAAGRDDLLIAAFTAWTEPTPWQTQPYGVEDKHVIALLSRLLALPGLDPVVRCRLLDTFAAEQSGNGDPAVRAAAEEAVALAERFGDSGLRAQTVATLARELDIEREWQERVTLGEELVRLGETEDLPLYRCSGTIILASTAAAGGDVDAVRLLVEENLALARSYRLMELIDVGECALAMFAHIAGDFDEAQRRYADAAQRMTRQGSLHGAGYWLLAEATVRVDQGRVGEFAPTAEALYENFGPVMADLLALSLIAAGRVEEARQVRGRDTPIRPDYFFTVVATFRAMTVVALGEREAAAELYATLLPYRDATLAGVASLSLAMQPVAHTLGDLAQLLGRNADAAAHFAQALAVAKRWHAPHWAANAQAAARQAR